MPWGKTRCTEMGGWEDRMKNKMMVAGGIGVTVGSILAVVQQQPMLRFTAASTASFLMLAGCFSVVQESSRLVRCRDSPLNSVAAGAATGALLWKSHGQSGVPGAVICAALGGAAHLASARVESAGGFAQLLVSLDLLDPLPETPHQRAEAERAQQAAAAEAEAAAAVPRSWWHQYLPVRKMSSSEWEEYKAQQDDEQRKRIDTALAGGLPVMVDRQRQQQQQQQQQEVEEEVEKGAQEQGAQGQQGGTAR